MNDYRDSMGFYHDTLKVSSNNGWIYTAIANHLGLPVNKGDLGYELGQSYANHRDFWINRRIGKVRPPISRDEIIGMVSLTRNKLLYGMLEFYEFNMSRHFSGSLIKAARILYSIKDEHRNYMWQNRLIEAYPLGFKLLPHDVYYIKKLYNRDTSILEKLAFGLYVVSTLVQKKVSPKNVLFVQLSDLKYKRILRLLNYKRNIIEYFGIDHIFSKEIQ